MHNLCDTIVFFFITSARLFVNNVKDLTYCYIQSKHFNMTFGWCQQNATTNNSGTNTNDMMNLLKYLIYRTVTYKNLFQNIISSKCKKILFELAKTSTSLKSTILVAFFLFVIVFRPFLFILFSNTNYYYYYWNYKYWTNWNALRYGHQIFITNIYSNFLFILTWNYFLFQNIVMEQLLAIILSIYK